MAFEGVRDKQVAGKDDGTYRALNVRNPNSPVIPDFADNGFSGARPKDGFRTIVSFRETVVQKCSDCFKKP